MNLDLPLWRALFPGGQTEALEGSICALSGSEHHWREQLRAAAGATSENDWLLVAADRSTAVRLLKIVPWRPSRSGQVRSRSAVVAAARDAGLETVATYTVWPSSGLPRVAYPVDNYRAFRWLQRTGVIGGGGGRIWARLLARSRFTTPLLWALAPGMILVCIKRGESGLT